MGAFLRKSLVWGFFGFVLAGGVFAQKQAVFKVSGPCMACGADRILGVVKGLDGVRSAKFDPNSSMLTVDFDPVAASVIDMQLEIVGSSDDDDLDLLNEELEEDEDLSTFVNGGDDDLIPGVDEDLDEDDSDE